MFIRPLGIGETYIIIYKLHFCVALFMIVMKLYMPYVWIRVLCVYLALFLHIGVTLLMWSLDAFMNVIEMP